MITYVILAEVVGAVVGHLIPPGGFFWFIVGGVGGYIIKHYTNRGY
jgi:hypothetical protein